MSGVRKLARGVALSMVLVAVSSGCNTCLNVTGVPFNRAASEGDIGVGDSGGVNDVATANDTANPPDMTTGDVDRDGACSRESGAQACAQASRNCGEYNWTDSCGDRRDTDCGACDPSTSTCDDGSGRCSCFAGYEDVGNGCEDIDECARNLDDCMAGENCSNLPGAWQCSTCPAGSLDVNGDGTLCTDIDECANNTDDCDPLSTCTNLDPFFSCGPCPSGYLDANGDGTQCNDIDECASMTDNCDPNATCSNAPGSFNCMCNSGWTGNGAVCSDIDECGTMTDNCDANASCTNLPGSFSCSCNAGYVGNGVSCVPVGQGQLVRSVSHAMIAATMTSGSVALPVGIDATKTVPFATGEQSGTADALQSMWIDVWVDGAAGLLRWERVGSLGTIDLSVELVEFQDATVTSGTFTVPFSNASVPHPLSTAELARSFVVFTSRATSLSDNTDDGLTSAVLDVTGIQFKRFAGTGTVDGHYYIVTADQAADLAVTRLTLWILDGDTCATATTTAPLATSFLIHSTSVFYTDGASGGSDTELLYVQCHLSSGSVQCCRGQSSGTDDTELDVFVSVLTMPNSSVQRGQVTMFGGSSNQSLSAVDLTRAMAWFGTSGVVGAAMVRGPEGSSADGAFVAASLPTTTNLSLTRGDTDPTTQVWWEVVEWP